MENEQILADLADRFETWKQKKDGEIRELREGLDVMAKHASRPGGGGTSGAALVTPEQRDHRDAFEAWLRNPRSEKTRAELTGIETRAASASVDTAGGFLVPEIIAGPLLRRARDANTLRQIVRTIQVASGDVRLPLSNADATSGWVGEGGVRAGTGEPTLAAPKPTFGMNYAYVEASEELVSDAIFDVATWFSEEAGAALGEAEAQAIVAGDGSDKPTGLLHVAPEAGSDGTRTAGAFQYIPSGAASTLGGGAQDLLADLVYGLKASYRVNGRWIMNSKTAGTIRKLKDGDGRTLWADGLAAGQPDRLLGYGVTISEAMPDIGADAHPIGFGDWNRAYCLADRGGLRVTIDDNISKPGAVRWYIRRRVGGIAYDTHAARFAKVAAS